MSEMLKWSLELNLGFPSQFLLIFIGIGISTYYMNYKVHMGIFFVMGFMISHSLSKGGSQSR